MVTAATFSKFTTLLHDGNRIDKDARQDARMHIENTEIDTCMPDWSPSATTPVIARKKERLDPFLLSQRAVLLQLRHEITDSMTDVATSSRSSREVLLPKTHHADAASDTYDREFALSLLSHEQDALYEIDHALRRIELGTYGICEMSGKPIPPARLEAIPFARFTVEVQSRVEEQRKALLLSQPTRPPLTPIESERRRRLTTVSRWARTISQRAFSDKGSSN